MYIFVLLFITLLTPDTLFAEPRTGVDTIYKNGNILTMNDSNDVVQAVAVKDGEIVAVGRNRDMRTLAGHKTEVVNLHRKTLMPGFYDAHSHFVFTGLASRFYVDLNSPPIGTINTLTEIIEALRARANETPAGEWIQGFGYDDTLIAEQTHPTRADLDLASTEHPIFITHSSGHIAVANSLALELAGITAATADPPGGVISRDADGEPTGVLIEAPATDLVFSLIPPPTFSDLLAGIAHASGNYAANGVTTANSGAAPAGFIPLLKFALAQGVLPIRVIVWPTLEEADAANDFVLETNMITVGGVKEFADGSIQGYSGYLSEPYHVQPPGEFNFRGFPRHTREILVERLTEAHCKGYQSLVHGNGDAAIDDILHAWAEAQVLCPREDPRFVVIHSQMAREDQLDKMVELNAIPSFFMLHTFYWGDRHRDIFMGPERASRMSPARSAADRSLRFTIHNDTPVVPMNPLLSVWAAVNRLSTSGEIIGEDQRITPIEALRATTIEAAYQNFEEEMKGSIEVGKLADFVILSADPLEVVTDDIKDIRVLQTIVGGKTVYQTE
ncbi:amidohydrolase [Amphritea sp. HPY]|uniref:amidohydrolase n=1 Tax=Amphritea sp. HPY TaxID=3421652 RepID=UPI003D7D7B3A